MPPVFLGAVVHAARMPSVFQGAVACSKDAPSVFQGAVVHARMPSVFRGAVIRLYGGCPNRRSPAGGIKHNCILIRLLEHTGFADAPQPG
ncbi:hypothetical protein CYMTET_18293 [Cymbomonas tetramitiformis]|uniref:Uncharacterized protein n=1 Tax=Cymbomonas tetramitiformis TaxID=36881 RepID=A0AAE0L6B4_9CHLO|nr:hypothetical protein CYMTET_18293 [Cymbomonas tetramitiformis]